MKKFLLSLCLIPLFMRAVQDQDPKVKKSLRIKKKVLKKNNSNKNLPVKKSLFECADNAELLKSIQAGADVNERRDNNSLAFTPLAEAVYFRDNERVALLLEHGADPYLKYIKVGTCSHCETSALHEAAAYHGAGDIVKLLLARGVPVDLLAHHGTPLMYAANGGSLNTVELLLEAGADVNASHEGVTALHCAAGMNPRNCCYPEVVDLLLDRGADLNAGCEDRRVAPVLSVAASADSSGNPKSGNPRVVRRLLDKKAYLNVLDASGNSVMHYAIRENKYRVIKEILKRGKFGWYNKEERFINLIRPFWRLINLPNNDGDTPLMAAARHKKWKIMMQLLWANASIVNEPSSSGSTVFHLISCDEQDAKKEAALDKLFARFKGDIDMRDADGRTPLMIAADRGDIQVAQRLLDRGASVDSKDNANLTALDYARRMKERLIGSLDHPIAKYGYETFPDKTEVYIVRYERLIEMLEQDQKDTSWCTIL